MCLPPQNISDQMLNKIKNQTQIIAKSLKVKGFMNIQFAIKDNELFILEVNPRGSRTIPFVAKATGHPLVNYACQIMIGRSIQELKLKENNIKHVCVKEAVFLLQDFKVLTLF